jgi:hypothetical protein
VIVALAAIAAHNDLLAEHAEEVRAAIAQFVASEPLSEPHSVLRAKQILQNPLVQRLRSSARATMRFF